MLGSTFFTAQKGSLGKVMFSPTSVIPLSTGEGWLNNMHHKSNDQEGSSSRAVGLPGAVVCIQVRLDRPPETHGILRDTVNKQVVRLILEYIHVFTTFQLINIFLFYE